MDFAEEPAATIKFFSSIEHNLQRGVPTFINLHVVRWISADALMYLLALLDVFAQRQGRRLRVRGNLPGREPARSNMMASGFSQRVQGLKHARVQSDDILQIQSDSRVQPKVAHELIAFATRRLELQRSPCTRAAYALLIEAMSNVVEHAYPDGESVEHKWWAMAQFDPKHQAVRFTVVDYGDGIAATMRRTLIEKLTRKLSISNDVELVESALRGEFRSSTGKQFRGRGLPKMREELLSGNISDLVIVTSRAVIRGEQGANLDTQFNGTIVSFCIGARAGHEEDSLDI